MEAPLVEVFTSIQGEGLYVGQRHLFVRMAGCNLACTYCDTPRNIPDYCLLEQTPGRGDFSQVRNPVSSSTLLTHLSSIDPHLYGAVSFTGGEPLLHPGFLVSVLPYLRHRGWKTYLETNGTLPDSLVQVIDFCDIIAMDYKLPSATGQPLRQEEHRCFLSCAKAAELFVKTVVSAATTLDEMDAAAQVIAEEAPNTPLIIQPVTIRDGCQPPPTPGLLLDLQEAALRYLPVVRVIPQTHVIIEMR